MDTLGLIALLLAVPLGIAANLLTPTIKNWWAKGSEKRLLKRIEDLEKELKICSREIDFKYNAWLSENIISILETFGFGLYLYLSLSLIEIPSTHWLRRTYILVVAVFIAMSAVRANSVRVKARHIDNPQYITKLEKNIALLKSKLEPHNDFFPLI